MQDTILAHSEDEIIQYQKLTPKYLEDAIQVTGQVLILNGNVCKILGVPDDPEAVSELEQLPLTAAKDGISVIAIDKNTDKVVGVAINKFLIKSQPFFEGFLSKLKNFRARQLIEFIIGSDNMCDVFEHCKVNCAMEILFLGVRSEYRKRGIAQKLVELSVELAQNLQDGINVKESVDGSVLDLDPVPEVVYTIFTSFISQRIGRQLGFEIGAQRSMEKMEIFGKVYENANVHTSVSTMEFKMLRPRKTD